MASTYTTNIRLTKQGDGDNANTWGDTWGGHAREPDTPPTRSLARAGRPHRTPRHRAART